MELKVGIKPTSIEYETIILSLNYSSPRDYITKNYINK